MHTFQESVNYSTVFCKATRKNKIIHAFYLTICISCYFNEYYLNDTNITTDKETFEHAIIYSLLKGCV